MYTIKLVQEPDIEILSEIFSKSFSEADKEKPWDKKIGIRPDEHAVLIKGNCEDILNNLS